MKGTNHGGFLLRVNEPYATSAEAEDRIRRIRRDNPEMTSDNTLKAGNNIWYYEVVRYGNGWAVLSSYSTITN